MNDNTSVVIMSYLIKVYTLHFSVKFSYLTQDFIVTHTNKHWRMTNWLYIVQTFKISMSEEYNYRLIVLLKRYITAMPFAPVEYIFLYGKVCRAQHTVCIV